MLKFESLEISMCGKPIEVQGIARLSPVESGRPQHSKNGEQSPTRLLLPRFFKA
jgi:hypothetical protein